MADAPPSVFISYSWDSEAHKTWVRELAERLALNGVHAKLDQWDVGPGDSLTQFMEAEIPNSDFVVIICTQNYAQRSQTRTGGVGYEQQIISGHIAAGIPRAKFLPVVRTGQLNPGPDTALPAHFSGILAIDMRDSESADSAFEQLLRAIFREPVFARPPLGEKPVLGSLPNPAEPPVTRLPILEIDGWHLHSGVSLNQQHPDTFYLPTEAERRSVPVGHFAKLSFGITQDDKEEPEVGERMWVEILHRDGPYYIGSLANQPSCFVYVRGEEGKEEYMVDDEALLTFGSQVVFLPEHVIDIASPEYQEAGRQLLDAADNSTTPRMRLRSAKKKPQKKKK